MVIFGMNEVAVAWNGPRLWENGGTGSRKVFGCFRGFWEAIKIKKWDKDRKWRNDRKFRIFGIFALLAHGGVGGMGGALLITSWQREAKAQCLHG